MPLVQEGRSAGMSTEGLALLDKRQATWSGTAAVDELMRPVRMIYRSVRYEDRRTCSIILLSMYKVIPDAVTTDRHYEHVLDNSAAPTTSGHHLSKFWPV